MTAPAARPAPASGPGPAPVVEVAGLCRAFGGVRAVDGIGFRLEAGERLALIGPNGAGKSTCFALLDGQLRPDSGSIRILGRETTGLAPRHIWRMGVGRTFQITATFGSMTVRENVQTALMSRDRRLGNLWRRARDLFAAEADGLLRLVGVADQAARPCGILAWGDLRRVELAVALAGDPRVLLMDEPTAGMAPAERGEMMALVSRIAGERGIGILFTEHDMDVVFAAADRILVLDRGRLVAAGKPAEVAADPEVRRIYLGEGPSPGGAA